MKKYIDIIVVKIFDFIYKKQQIKSKKRLEKLKKSIVSGKYAGKKLSASSGAILTIDENSNEKKVNQEKVEKIICSCLNQPEKFFEYIKGANTPVYKLKFARNILAVILEHEGLIYPKRGIKALYLNLILNKKISFKTSEMFVVSSYKTNPYIISYQFYNWYCYKMGLEGYEAETQEYFKNVFEICESEKINELDFDEILSLKSAIKRDIEAIEFVKNIAIKQSMAKKNLEKIKNKKDVRI